jgi:hypothetical protein
MSKNNQIITGIIVILLIVGGTLLWYFESMPSKQTKNDIKQTAEKGYKNIDKNILSSANAEKVFGRQINGQVPVEVNKSDIGKSNPFQ